MSTLSPEELLTAAKTLVESYANDLDIDELYHFAKLLIYLKTMSQETSALFLYKLISDKGVQDTFPDVAIALRMYLVLIVTNCSAERSFSKLITEANGKSPPNIHDSGKTSQSSYHEH